MNPITDINILVNYLRIQERKQEDQEDCSKYLQTHDDDDDDDNAEYDY